MDLRFLIVGAPFIFAALYTLLWLTKWGAFNTPNDQQSKKMVSDSDYLKENLAIENIFLTKN